MNESTATRYQRTRRRARVAGGACGLAVLGIAALTPAGRTLAAWAERVTGDLSPGLRDAAALVVFVAVLVAVWEIALAVAMLLWRSPDRGRRDAGGGSVAGQLAAAALALPAAIWCGGLVLAGAWLAGERWWMLTGAVLLLTLIGLLHTVPAFLARLAGTRPLHRPALIERLGALARRLRVDIHSIEEVSSASSVTATALVAGAGQSRRVFIASDLLRDWPDEEIAVVVAHEFGHHAHHDLWWTVAFDAVVLFGGLVVAEMVRGATGHPAASLSALPMVAFVAWSTFIAATPLRHALSRWQERRADAFALRLTGGAAEFRTALRRLASQHLVEERPSRVTRWLYHRHPTVAERLSFADDFERCDPR